MRNIFRKRARLHDIAAARQESARAAESAHERQHAESNHAIALALNARMDEFLRELAASPRFDPASANCPVCRACGDELDVTFYAFAEVSLGSEQVMALYPEAELPILIAFTNQAHKHAPHVMCICTRCGYSFVRRPASVNAFPDTEVDNDGHA